MDFDNIHTLNPRNPKTSTRPHDTRTHTSNQKPTKKLNQMRIAEVGKPSLTGVYGSNVGCLDHNRDPDHVGFRLSYVFR